MKGSNSEEAQLHPLREILQSTLRTRLPKHIGGQHVSIRANSCVYPSRACLSGEGFALCLATK